MQEGCSICEQWYHVSCVTASSTELDSSVFWFCKSCLQIVRSNFFGPSASWFCKFVFLEVLIITSNVLLILNCSVNAENSKLPSGPIIIDRLYLFV